MLTFCPKKDYLVEIVYNIRMLKHTITKLNYSNSNTCWTDYL